MADELQSAREIINQADAEMAETFVRRMEAAAQIAAYKKDHGMPILDAAREEMAAQIAAKEAKLQAELGT